MKTRKGDAEMPRRAYSLTRISSRKQREGSGLKRQARFAPWLAKKHGWLLDTSFNLSDLIVSAHKGKQRLVGAMAGFLDGVKGGTVSPGSILIVENLDRLSREEIDLSFDLVLDLLRAGISIYTMKPRREYTPESVNNLSHREEIQNTLYRAWEESHIKGYRVRRAWKRKQKKARLHKRPMTKKVPGWMKVERKAFVLIPDRVAIVQQIFKWAVEGFGPGAICGKLNADPGKYPAWGYSGRWARNYVVTVLAMRQVLGEHQPLRPNEDGLYRPHGEPILDYYPRIISDEDFNIVRGNIKGRFKKSGRRCKDTVNIFSSLVWDAVSGEQMHQESNHQKGVTRRYWRVGYWIKRESSGPGNLTVPYEDLERGALAALDMIEPEDFIKPLEGDDTIGKLIAEKTKELASLESQLVILSDKRKKDGSRPGVLDFIIEEVARIGEEKVKVVSQLKGLKLTADSGRGEAVAEAQSIAEAREEKTGDERESLDLRLKGKLTMLVDSVWVLPQPITRMKRILHVQLFLKGGESRYFQVLPSSMAGVKPWQLDGVDLREWRNAVV